MAILRIVETERSNLKSVKDVEHLNYSIDQHMKKIKEHSDSKKIVKFFQLLSEYSVVYAGVSFRRNKLWAKELSVSVRTIQRYTQFLADLNVIIKIPTDRKNNRGQATNTICILPVIKSVVSRVCHGVCHAFNPSFKPFKQESNIYTASKEISMDFIPKEIKNKPSFQNIVNMYSVALYDKVKAGLDIDYISSLVNKDLKHKISLALYDERAREIKRQEQREAENERLAIELGIRKDKPLPFYNWLES